MEYAGWNSQDAMPTMKEGNSTFYQNPCKAPNGRRLRWILFFSELCFGEFVNLFNVNSIVQFNNVTVTTNANGELGGGLPDFRARNQSTSQDSRQFQLGFKFIF